MPSQPHSLRSSRLSPADTPGRTSRRGAGPPRTAHPSRPAAWSTFALLFLGAAGAPAGNLEPRATDLAAKYEAFTLVQGPQRRLLMGNQRGTLTLLESQGGQLRTAASRELWSPVLELVAADLDGNGQDEVVGATQDFRLFVLRGTDLSDIWSTPPGRFQSLSALTVADVDNDGEKEITFVADDLLHISSALKDVEEWKSADPRPATDIAVGDVDGDGQSEIVLNTGLVLGAAFRDVKWEYEPGFGVEVDLFDVDADGILEVISLGGDGLMRVFDVDKRQVKSD